jgi:hypothetical protein
MEAKMADDVAEIEAKIRALSAEERAELIRSFIADLDEPSRWRRTGLPGGSGQAPPRTTGRDGSRGPRGACVREPALTSEALMKLEFHPEAE